MNTKAPFIIKFIIIIFFATLLPVLWIVPQSQSQGVPQIKEKEEAVRAYMLKITRQLGTNCSTCHDINNYTDQRKEAYQVAKEHIKYTQLLIDAGMDSTRSKAKADCYMCHRGHLIPDYKEPFNPLVMDRVKRKNALGSEDPSTINDIQEFNEPLIDGESFLHPTPQ